MNDLSDDDKALLSWSGELEGEPPAEVGEELDELARAVRRLPQELAPDSALPSALARHQQVRAASPWPAARLALYAVAAALVVFAGASFLLKNPSQPSQPEKSPIAESAPVGVPMPENLFPKSETPNLKRIRDARARILKIKHRAKSRPTRNQGGQNQPSPFLS